jgi:hypothetical protein
MSRELRWVTGKHGWQQSAQGDIALFVAQEIGGWIFWAARTKARQASYLVVIPGLATREAAMSAAQSWFDDYLSASQDRSTSPAGP